MIGSIGEGLYELGVDEGSPGSPRAGYGGDTANTAVMAARLGDGRFCGRVGDDALGRELLAFWRDAGVDTRFVALDPAPTRIYVNERLADSGCRFHYHRQGSAGSRLSSDDVTDEFVDGLEALHYSGITLSISTSAAAAARSAARRARDRGALVSFAVNYRPALHPDVRELAAAAHSADVVFATAEEAELVLGGARPAGPPELVITLGEGGAVVFAGGEEIRIAAPPVELVDATGAGDALAAVYLAARATGAPPAEALRHGVAAATLSCRAFGAARSYPEASELEAAVPA